MQSIKPTIDNIEFTLPQPEQLLNGLKIGTEEVTKGETSPAGLIITQVYLGDYLGFYQALSDGSALTVYEIAIWTGTEEALVQAWLELQAAAGLLTLDNPEAKPAARRFRLLPAQARKLAEWHNQAHLRRLAEPTTEKASFEKE